MSVQVEGQLFTVDEYYKMLEVGIPEYWIINLQEEQVEVHQKPIRGRYTFQQILFPEDPLRLEAPDWELPIATLFK